MTKFKIKICMREILTSYCFCPDLYRLKRYKQVEKTCKIKDEKKKKKKKRCCSLPRQLPERVQYNFYALIEKIPTISPEAGDYVFCYTSQLQSADHANQYANHIRTLNCLFSRHWLAHKSPHGFKARDPCHVICSPPIGELI